MGVKNHGVRNTMKLSLLSVLDTEEYLFDKKIKGIWSRLLIIYKPFRSY